MITRDDPGPAPERWVITGAGSGIGYGLAMKLAAEGARVTACVRDEQEHAALVARTDTMSTLTFDARHDDTIRAAAARSDEPVDALVACTGIFGGRRSALEMDFDEALDLYSVNALGPLRAARAFLPRLRRGTNPRVGLVSSVLGSMTVEGTTNLAYRASKSALNKLAQALAEDLESSGIAVIALEPGWVRTAMGGPDAPMSVDESVAGIVATMRGLTLEQTGRFLDHRGEVVPW